MFSVNTTFYSEIKLIFGVNERLKSVKTVL